jgi:hypothetical protein
MCVFQGNLAIFGEILMRDFIIMAANKKISRYWKFMNPDTGCQKVPDSKELGQKIG